MLRAGPRRGRSPPIPLPPPRTIADTDKTERPAPAPGSRGRLTGFEIETPIAREIARVLRRNHALPRPRGFNARRYTIQPSIEDAFQNSFPTHRPRHTSAVGR